MEISVVYLLQRVVYRIGRFFYYWYVGGFLAVTWWLKSMILNLDAVLAVRVTLLNFFQPLYQDYTPLGRVLGVIFRFFRICIGMVLYPFFFALAAAAYLCWALIPVLIVIFGARSYPYA